VGSEPGARAVGQGGVPCAGLQQGPQREIDGQRLAAGAAAIGLQRVTEAAVGVAVGGDGVADGSGVTAAERALELPPLEHASVGGEELLCSLDVG
jgi:hypothetical protein